MKVSFQIEILTVRSLNADTLTQETFNEFVN